MNSLALSNEFKLTYRQKGVNVNEVKIAYIYMCKNTASTVEVFGYSIFVTRPIPVGQDRYPYPYPTRTQNYYPPRPVPAGIPVPVTVQPSQVPMHCLCSYQADRLANRHVVIV